MADQWLAGKVNLKTSTFALYQSILGTHVLPRWRDVPLIHVEHGEVQAWVACLVASGLSPSHVRDVVGVLSGVLGLAVRDRRLPPNPAPAAESGACRRIRRTASTSRGSRSGGAGTWPRTK
jgi:hypothetical protein